MKDERLGWLTPDWPVPPSVRALSTHRGGGVSQGPYASMNLGLHVKDAASSVMQNRRLLAATAKLPREPSWLCQVHGSDVRDLDLESSTTLGGAATAAEATAAEARAAEALPAADAAVTGCPGRICAILTADCVPVLLAAQSGKRVGAAHAGWRGLAAGVVEAAVAALGSPGQDILAWLGPAIGPDNFEVGDEVREALLRADPGAASAFVANTRGRWCADLYALVRRRLLRLGVHRVYGGGECTYASADRYFSHRRDGVTGRQATLIWLEG